MNKFIKVLCSFPIILLFLYFIPFIGICLLLARNFVYTKKTYIEIYLIIIGVIILIPKALSSLLYILKLKVTTIPYLTDIINSSLYNTNFINYSKLLLIVGIIFMILNCFFKKAFDKIEHYIISYLNHQDKINKDVSIQNDLKIKEKQERAKNTHVIKCPNCGSNNILTEQTGICKYCRSPLEYKD